MWSAAWCGGVRSKPNRLVNTLMSRYISAVSLAQNPYQGGTPEQSRLAPADFPFPTGGNFPSPSRVYSPWKRLISRSHAGARHRICSAGDRSDACGCRPSRWCRARPPPSGPAIFPALGSGGAERGILTASIEVGMPASRQGTQGMLVRLAPLLTHRARRRTREISIIQGRSLWYDARRRALKAAARSSWLAIRNSLAIEQPRLSGNHRPGA